MRRPNYTYTPAVVDVLTEMRLAGKSATDIAEVLGVSIGSVSIYCHRNGIHKNNNIKVKNAAKNIPNSIFKEKLRQAKNNITGSYTIINHIPAKPSPLNNLVFDNDGQSITATLSNMKDDGLFIKLISWDDTKEHAGMKKLLGREVRIIIDVVE